MSSFQKRTCFLFFKAVYAALITPCFPFVCKSRAYPTESLNILAAADAKAVAESLIDPRIFCSHERNSVLQHNQHFSTQGAVYLREWQDHTTRIFLLQEFV